MRVIILLILFTIYARLGTAQSTVSYETGTVAAFCKVWGFLKYYHPEVARGKYNWDSVFLAQLEVLPSLHTKEEFNTHYLHFLSELSDVTRYPQQTMDYDTTYTPVNPLNWIETNSLFSADLKHKLYNVAAHRNTKNGYYIKQKPLSSEFIHEKKYEELGRNHTSTKHLLLGLARFWNAVQYFYPYKYMTSQDWESVLPEMIEKAYNVQSIRDCWYWHAELLGKVEDTHTAGLLGYRLPVVTKIIDNKAIVTEVLNDSLATINNLQVRDIIHSINDTTIKDYIGQIRKYYSASNESAFQRMIGTWGLGNINKEATFRIERDGEILTKKIKLYNYRELKLKKDEPNVDSSWKILDSNIGYLRTDMLYGHQVHRVIKKLLQTKGIIIDLRTYPEWIVYPLCRELGIRKTPFCTYIATDVSYPGTYKFNSHAYCGRKRKRRYYGKIVILVNEVTQSRGEFTATALQTLPDAVTIGSQTGGTDGGVIPITFPGGKTTYITGNGIYYADMTPTQHAGVRLDIEVRPTIKGIKEGRDEVLDRAVKYINIGE